MNCQEMSFVKQAFDSNCIAPLGPQVDAFEKELSEYAGIAYCVALASESAAMHWQFAIWQSARAMKCSLVPP